MRKKLPPCEENYPCEEKYPYGRKINPVRDNKDLARDYKDLVGDGCAYYSVVPAVSVVVAADEGSSSAVTPSSRLFTKVPLR